MWQFGRALRTACGFWALTTLVACGGGGSGSGAGGGDTSTSGSTGTGLVPAPLALGPLLYADATTLRPLRAGATWTYRGHDTPYPGAPVAVYSDVVTHAAAGAGVSESGTNPFNQGAASQTVVASGGAVQTTVPIDLPNGPTNVTFPELRSPVRQNDQVTVLDEHIADVGFDLDGDGKTESADIAVYWVVVGTEDVTPENLPTLHTVRVDLVELVRFKLSVNGQYTPTVEAQRQSTWYAAGIGVVRQRLQEPSDTVGTHVAEEFITSWDGISEGLGYTVPAIASVPAGSSAYAGQTLPAERAAVAFDDHAVMLSAVPNLVDCCSSLISVLDLRGHVTATRAYAKPPTFAQTNYLLRNGSELAWILSSQTDPQTFAVARFDAFGNVIGDPQGAAFSLAGQPSAVQLLSASFAADGTGIWVAWVRRYVTPLATFADQLVARGFDLTGQPTTPEIVVVDWGTTVGDYVVPTVVAHAQQVVIEWMDGPGTRVGAVNYAIIAAPFTQATVKQLTRSSSFTSLRTLDLVSGFGFVWSDATQAYALQLNASLDPLFSPGNDLANESMSLGWGAPLTGAPAAAVVGNGMVLAGPVHSTFWQDDPVASTVNLIADYTLPTGPLASAVPGRITRLPGSPEAGPGDNFLGPVRRVLLFPDRVLVFGGSSFSLITSVVWRR